MLVSEYVNIYVNNYNKKKLEDILGFELNDQLDQNVKIPVELLPDGSGYKVEVICYFCNYKFENEWRKYLKLEKNKEKHCCGKKDCLNIKRKQSSLKKWGVDNPSKSDLIKSKQREKNIEKWGVEHYSKTDEYKDKIRETAISKWGVEHYSKTDEYKLKYKKTSLERWGFDNPSKSEMVKSKQRKTNLERWGVDNYSKTEDFIKKIKSTGLDKWGVEHYSQSDECKEKVRLYSISKWGVDNFNKSRLSKIGKKIFSDNYVEYLEDKISKYLCENGHYFEISSDVYLKRLVENINVCTICNPISDQKSIKEKELSEFINSIYGGSIIESYRDVLEIDIYLPEISIGIEFNGLYYHSDKFKDRKCHLNKTEHFKKRGIRIIHIWEDDWKYKNEIIKSQIKNWLNLTENKVYARNCIVREVKNSKIVTEFLNKNHIQGQVASSLKLGLYYGDELVSIMTFDHYEGRKKMPQNNWNINRFCNKLNYNILGAASKLFNYFINEYKPNRIISYADSDWSKGDLYYKLGFKKINITTPDYKYIVDGKRIHKSRYKKSKINTKLTESQYTKNNNILRIYDCGKIKFEKLL